MLQTLLTKKVKLSNLATKRAFHKSAMTNTRFMVAIDGSPECLHAAKIADSLMKNDDQGYLIFVTEPIEVGHMRVDVCNYLPQDAIGALKDANERRNREVEKSANEVLKDSTKEWKWLFREGPPGYTLCKEARAQDVDYLVLGERGWGGLKRRIMGSVCSYVLHHASCNVVITKNEQHARDDWSVIE